MTTAAHLKAVTAWLASVANATPPLADVEDRIKDMAVILAETLPNSAMFCTQSAIYVALEAGFFPSAKRAKELLETWWGGHTPAVPVLPSAVDGAGLDRREQLMAKNWLDLHASGAKDRELGVALSVVRRHAPAAFAWLAKTHLFAEQIARRHDWLHDAAPATSAERAAMPSIGQALAAALHPDRTLPAEAPGEAPGEGRAMAPTQESTPPPGALKPEFLAAIRDANPAVQSARAVAALVAEERARELVGGALVWADDDSIDPPLAPLSWPDE